MEYWNIENPVAIEHIAGWKKPVVSFGYASIRSSFVEFGPSRTSVFL